MDINPQDIEHDDVVGDVLIRILSGRVAEDPLSKEKKEPSLWLTAEIDLDDLLHVCQMAEKSFQQQEPLLDIERSFLPIHVVADLHGQVSHALRLFHTIGSPQKETYLFLGDFVDRGVQGLELMLLLFCLKIRYPCQVFLLRGNHEDVNTNLNYGFYEECLLRYPLDQATGERVWRAFLGAFNWMPLAAVISGKKGRIFCCHGGISPFIRDLADINTVQRPSIVPPFGIACDLVWADPGNQSGWAISHRGISFVFGQDVLEAFCKRNNIDLVLRGHQINEKMHRHGYKMNPGGRLITFFSAPNYMNYKNNGCVVRIDQNLRLQYKVFRVKTPSLSDLVPKKKTSQTLFRKKNSKVVPKPEPIPRSGEQDTEVDDCSKEPLFKPARSSMMRTAQRASTPGRTSTPKTEDRSSIQLKTQMTQMDRTGPLPVDRTAGEGSLYEKTAEEEAERQPKKRSQLSRKKSQSSGARKYN